MFDTAHTITRIPRAYVVAANRIAAGEFGRAFLRLVARSDFRAFENGKARATNRFRRNDSGSARESAGLAKARIHYLFLRNRFIMSDTAHRECVSTISYPLVCVLGRDGNTSKLQIRHRLDLHLPHPA